MKDLRTLKEMANDNGLTLIKAELDTGLTLAHIAKGSADEKQKRNRSNARKAYDAVLRFRDRVYCTPSDADRIEARLGLLKSELEEIGEHF